jgi:hypothetical protein
MAGIYGIIELELAPEPPKPLANDVENVVIAAFISLLSESAFVEYLLLIVLSSNAATASWVASISFEEYLCCTNAVSICMPIYADKIRVIGITIIENITVKFCNFISYHPHLILSFFVFYF